MVPLLDFAEDQIFWERSPGHSVKYLADLVRPHAMQDHQRLARDRHIYQRLLGTEAEAPGLHELHVEPAPADCLVERVEHTLGTVARAAGTHANGDTGSPWLQFGDPRVTNRVEGAVVANRHLCSGLLLRERVEFALQSRFIHVAEDRVVHLDDRRERALAEAGDGPERHIPIGGGNNELVGFGIAFRSEIRNTSAISRTDHANLLCGTQCRGTPRSCSDPAARD